MHGLETDTSRLLTTVQRRVILFETLREFCIMIVFSFYAFYYYRPSQDEAVRR